MTRGPTVSAPIEVWYLRAEDVAGELVEICERLLTEEDRTRRDRFVFDKNKHEYLVTRALCRAVLSHRLGVAPMGLAFRRNEHGRPELDPAGSLRFNLTNTVTLVACGVVEGREIGIDTEPLARWNHVLEVAETVFTTRERDMLARCEPVIRQRRAVELWTLKEAYMKARGMGMAIPPESFALDLDATPIGLDLCGRTDDDAHRWKLETHEVHGHILATCVERGQSGDQVMLHAADLRSLLRAT